MRSVVPLAACVLVLASCGKQVNPEYCESALHANDPLCHQNFFLDAAIDAAISCAGNPAACTGTADPVCDTTKGICVQCMVNTQCALMTPICDQGTETCRGCSVDAECPSAGDICLPSGSCADPSEVVYVDSVTGGGATCSFATPCKLIQDGIAAAVTGGKKYIKVKGTFTENVRFGNVGPLTLIAERGTSLAGPDPAKPIVELAGTTTADLWRLTITGGANTTAAVQLTAGGTQTVGLHEMVIAGPPAPINTSGARTQAPGVLVQAGKLMMEKSVISGFEPVGVEIDAAAGAFDLENNFISDNGYQKNGSGGTTYGGVAILITNAATSTFAWNTVAFNGNTNNGNAPGVYCTSGLLSGTGNLLFGNRGGSTNEYSTACQITNSLQHTDPKFKSGANPPYDLHLTSASTAAVDKAGQGCPAQDIDDQARPYGAQCDYGADEYQ